MSYPLLLKPRSLKYGKERLYTPTSGDSLNKFEKARESYRRRRDESRNSYLFHGISKDPNYLAKSYQMFDEAVVPKYYFIYGGNESIFHFIDIAEGNPLHGKTMQRLIKSELELPKIFVSSKPLMITCNQDIELPMVSLEHPSKSLLERNSEPSLLDFSVLKRMSSLIFGNYRNLEDNFRKSLSLDLSKKMISWKQLVIGSIEHRISKLLEINSIESLFEAEAILEYSKVNDTLWKRFDRNEITFDELLINSQEIYVKITSSLVLKE